MKIGMSNMDDFETDTPQNMDMPTSCPCGNWIELNDMNNCRICGNLFCHECVPRNGGVCPMCDEDGEKSNG